MPEIIIHSNQFLKCLLLRYLNRDNGQTTEETNDDQCGGQGSLGGTFQPAAQTLLLRYSPGGGRPTSGEGSGEGLVL